MGVILDMALVVEVDKEHVGVQIEVRLAIGTGLNQFVHVS